MSAFTQELSIEFDKIVGKITDMMASYRRGLGTIEEAHRNALFSRIESLMSEEEDLFKQMELEMRGGTATEKASFVERKNRHNVIKSDFLNIKSDHQRALLIATGGGSAEKTAYRDAQREKLENSKRKLEQCARTLGETEAIATDTIEELGRNHQTIEAASSNAKLVNKEIDDVTVVVKRMDKRDNAMQNCVVM